MASRTLPGTMGFIHLLRRSLVYRKGRVAAMLAGLTLSAAVVTALLGIYADLNAKLNLEFRSFGANVVLTAANDASLPDDIATQVGHIAGPGASAVPLAFAVADLPDQTPVVIAGTDLKPLKAMNPWWKLTSRSNEHGVIAGERAWQAAGSPARLRAVGVDEAAGQDQLERAAVADDARQADRAEVDERHAEAPVEAAEDR